jgi:hypothetical protein
VKKIWLILLLTAAGISAQDKDAKEKPATPVVQRLFILKYAEPRQLSELLSVFNARIRQSPDFHALSIEASQEAMHAIEDAIQRLDVPSASPKNVEITMFLIAASDGAAAGAAIPKDLDAVVTQLRGSFPFKNYALLDAIAFHSRTGQQVRTSSSGESFTFGSVIVPVLTNLSVNGISLGSDGGALRLERLVANIRVPMASGPTGSNQYQYQNLEMQTDLDVKEGQKVVVGRLGLSHDQALFLVLMGKVL